MYKKFVQQEAVFMEFQGKQIATFQFLANSSDRNIVMIHGLDSSTQFNYPVILNLQKQFNIYTLDLPGHGQSQQINYYSLQNISLLFNNLIAFYNIQKFLVLGHSMGGLVAADLSQLQNCQGVILSCPAGIQIKMSIRIGLFFLKKLSKWLFAKKDLVVNTIYKEIKKVKQVEIADIKKQYIQNNYQQYCDNIIQVITQFPLQGQADVFKKINTSIGLILSKHDQMVCNNSIRRVFKNKDVNMKYLDSKHEVTMAFPELYAETVIQLSQNSQ